MPPDGIIYTILPTLLILSHKKPGCAILAPKPQILKYLKMLWFVECYKYGFRKKTDG